MMFARALFVAATIVFAPLDLQAQASPVANAGESREWAAYGQQLYREERHREAVAAFERAIQLHAPDAAVCAWNVARAYAHMDNRKQALRWIDLAFRFGFSDRSAVQQEPEFGKYLSDPAFRKRVEGAVAIAGASRTTD